MPEMQWHFYKPAFSRKKCSHIANRAASMPALANIKHEKFVLALFEGLSTKAAYEKAGYVGTNAATARKLAKQYEIVERLRELQEGARERSGITVEQLTKELWNLKDIAAGCRQPGAGVGAVMGIAKLHGLIVDKVEQETIRKPSRTPTTDTKLSMEEWQQKFAPKLQ
jgi:hypothetical protein